VLVLAEEATVSTDSRALATLLLVRDIQRQRLQKGAALGEERLLVSEVLDPHTRKLVVSLNQSDYIMSNDIVSAVLAQVAECRDMNAVTNEFLTDVGSEFYLKPVREFAFPEDNISFYDIMARCLRHNQVSGNFNSFFYRLIN
jgi:dihydroorotase